MDTNHFRLITEDLHGDMRGTGGGIEQSPILLFPGRQIACFSGWQNRPYCRNIALQS